MDGRARAIAARSRASMSAPTRASPPLLAGAEVWVVVGQWGHAVTRVFLKLSVFFGRQRPRAVRVAEKGDVFGLGGRRLSGVQVVSQNSRFVIDRWERSAGYSRFGGAQVGPQRAVCKIGFAAIGEAQGPKVDQRLLGEQITVAVVEKDAIAFGADAHEALVEAAEIAGAGDDFGACLALGERHLFDVVWFDPAVGVDEQVAVVVKGGCGE